MDADTGLVLLDRERRHPCGNATVRNVLRRQAVRSCHPCKGRKPMQPHLASSCAEWQQIYSLMAKYIEIIIAYTLYILCGPTAPLSPSCGLYLLSVGLFSDLSPTNADVTTFRKVMKSYILRYPSLPPSRYQAAPTAALNAHLRV